MNYNRMRDPYEYKQLQKKKMRHYNDQTVLVNHSLHLS
jgi:hypothetical protein